MKKYYRYFGGFLKAQTDFLNSKASKGYRLVKVNKLSYEFEPCEANAYQYTVDFVMDKANLESKDYKQFLEDMGYRVFYKGINLNFSILKFKWRPFAKGKAQLATPYTLGKELMIVERASEKSDFELHTTNEDKLAYYKSLRNAYLTPMTTGVFCIALCAYRSSFISLAMLLSLLIAAFGLVFVILYQSQIIKISQSLKHEE